MTGSDEAAGLGGLARSIDALFTQPTDAADEPAAGPDGSGASDEMTALASEVEELSQELDSLEAALAKPAGGDAEETVLEVPPVPDPVETLIEVPDMPGVAGGHAEETVLEAPPIPDPSETVLDVPGVPESDPTVLDAVLPDAVVSDAATPEVEVPTADAAAHAARHAELAESVEAYLAGDPGAGDRVAAAAAPLLEEFALDPLADAAERLVAAAGDPPDEATMEVTGSVMNPAVASKLVHRMGAERDLARREAYMTLSKRLGRIMAVAIRGAMTDATDRSARRAYYDALIEMGDASRPIIEGMVDDENRFLVRNAVAILGEIGGENAVDLVTSALANTDARVRKEACRALGKLKAEDQGQVIVAMLEDTDASVRTAAALTAAELKLERALRHICAMLEAEAENPEACIPLLRALGELGDPGAVPTIEKFAVGKMFSKPRTDVRIAAYQALHHMGTPNANRLLDRARKDKDADVKTAVTELLGSD